MDIDKRPIQFGKYRGKTPEEISDLDPDYLLWMYQNVKPTPCTKSLADACQQDEYDDDYARGVDQYFEYPKD